MDKNAEYAALKEAALKKILPGVLAPDEFRIEPLTLDECAALLAKGPGDVPSKMIVCRREKTALERLKTEFAKIGVTRLDDVIKAI